MKYVNVLHQRNQIWVSVKLSCLRCEHSLLVIFMAFFPSISTCPVSSNSYYFESSEDEIKKLAEPWTIGSSMSKRSRSGVCALWYFANRGSILRISFCLIHTLGALIPSASCPTLKVSIMSILCCDSEVWANVKFLFLRGSFIFQNPNSTIFNISHILLSPCPTCCLFKSYDLLFSYSLGCISTKKQSPSTTLLPSSGIQKVSSGRTHGCNVSYFATLMWLRSWPSLLFILSRACQLWGFQLNCKINLNHHSSCLPSLLFKASGRGWLQAILHILSFYLGNGNFFSKGLMFERGIFDS